MTYPDKIDEMRQMAATLGADVKALTDRVLDDPRFARWTGSLDNRHHYGTGGLQYHTWEVAMGCLASRDIYRGPVAPQLDERELFLAAIWHDMGKMWDYEELCGLGGSKWFATPHKTQVRHITRSAMEWEKAADAVGLAPELRNAVLHDILSHHGSARFGSPVAPQTAAAWALHLADLTSASLDHAWRAAQGLVQPLGPA